MSIEPFPPPGLGAIPRALEVPSPEAGVFPATYGQRALWFLDRLAPGNPAYVIAGAVRVLGDLDVPALRRAASGLGARHPALRTTFEASPGGPLQRVAPAPLDAVDFREIPGPATREEMPGRLAAAAFAPFDLAAGPLLRIAVLPLSDGGHALALAIHHIVADFWSLAILVRELGALYAREPGGEGAELPPPPALSPGDLAQREEERLSGCRGERLWQFWREALAGVPFTLDLPTDRPRPPVQGFRGSALSFALPPPAVAALRRATRRQGATLYMGLLAAFELLLARTAGQERLLVGCPTTGRVAPELSGVVGYLVNPVPIPGDLSGEPTLRELLGRVREAARAAFAHQGFPFPLLAERLEAAERDPSRSPVFQAALVLQKGRRSGEEEIASLAVGEAGVRIGFGPLALESIALPEPGVQFDLAVMVAESGDGSLRGRFQYDRDLFDRTTAERMAARFARLAAGLAAGLVGPNLRVSDLPWLSPAEVQQALTEWNDTGREPGPEGERTADEQVRELARKNPDRVAIADFAGTVTYGELVRRAERLAHRLAARGVRPETPVAVCSRRSAELVLAALAILRAGGTYVPLDPSYPRERLGFVLEDLDRPLVLAHPGDRDRLPGWASPLLLPTAEETPGERAAALPEPDLARRAYIIYTSGSTGRPKGVEVPHRSLANVLAWQHSAYPLSPADRATLVAGPSFDASLWETWTALSSGASLHVPPDEVRAAPSRLVEWLVREAITASFLPTPLAEAVAAEPWPARHALREVGVGGDRLHAPPGSALGFDFVNLYGPAECTLLSTACRVTARAPETPETPEMPGAPPIGRPLAATRLYLLDLWDRPAALGMAGELAIGGSGVARGYRGRPDLTAERFVPDPWAGAPGARRYLTGDRVRFRTGGDLDYLGRIDTQVKVRGVRVELGEIEALLAAHPLVREAAVEALPGPAGVRLVAYVVPAGDRGGEDLRRELRAYLGGHLPEPVVPGAYVALPELPLTPNGKVDRRALARLAPEPGRAGAAGSPAPRGETEELLAAIWARALGVPSIAADDDFFALGGHSLLATRTLAEMREAFGVELPVRRLFEVPRLADLAREVEAARGSGPSGVPAAPPLRPRPAKEREGPLPLSFALERLWFLDQLDPGSPAYNVPGAVALRGKLRVPALRAALAAVVLRHEALRTTFSLAGGSPVQEVAPRLDLPLPEVDLADLPERAREPEALRLAGEEARRGFDLGRGPLLRASLLRLSGAERWLLLTLHHIISDGWSLGVLVRDLSELYAAALDGRPAALPRLPVQYGDYALWQREWLAGEVLAGELAWWRERLAGSPTLLELPADRPRPAVQSFRGAHRPVVLAPELAAGVRAQSQAAGATLYMTLLAAWGALLSRYTGATDLLVGSPVAGRAHREVERLVGFFVNTLVLRLDLGGSPEGGRPGFAALVARSREATLAAYAHQDLPFERLVLELKPERHLGHAPLVQVLFALQNLPAADLALPGVEAQVLAVETGVAKFDLTLALREEGGTLRGVLEYAVDLFEGVTAERLLGHFATHLAAAVGAPERPFTELPLLSAAERHQVRSEWNDSGDDYPGEGFVHEIVAERARREPRATALVFDRAALTYGELDARAERIASRLRAAGVGPERLVAIAVERSFEMVAALLGIWKAGGAYLPLDRSLPPERLAFMLEDSGAAVLLTQAEAAPAFQALPAGRLRILTVEELQAAALPGSPAEAKPAALLLDQAAYVIYTSGSTGRPKGVVVTHRSLANRLGFARGVDLAPGDSFVHKTTVSFDASIVELFGPLLVGGTTYLARPGGESDPEYLIGLLRESAVPQASFTMAMLQAVLESGALATCGSLRTVLTGGEAIPPDLPARFHAQSGADLHNRYGPTEATISVTSWHCERTELAARGRAVPIGRPIARAEIHLLDRELQPVPVGVPGELCIAGVCLARGYLHRPELTADRFVPQPEAAEPGARLYRTGDLTRFRPDGAIEFVGRIDGQVKVRGFRVELGEIEAALAADAEVEAVAVVDREEPGTGNRRLVAYLVLRHGADQAPGEALREVRRRLAERVPAYLVPAVFVPLDRLPLSPTGKVDRKALPDPEPSRSGADDPPQGEIEELLAEVWADLLGTQGPIGRHESFFDLGGHSLLATRLVSRVRQAFGAELPLKAVFEHPSLAGVAAAVERALAPGAPGAPTPEAEASPILPAASPPAELPLSFAQERLWFLDRLEPGTPTYNLAGAVALAGRLDRQALARALAEIVRRHSALRTTFPQAGERPVQAISPFRPPDLPLADLAGLPEEARGPESRRLSREEALRPFDLARGPLLRLALLRLEAEGTGHRLLVSLHHIVADGWSIGVLVRELGALYGAFVAGRPSPLPELPIQYSDFALWQRSWLAGERLDAESAWWRETLAGLQPLDLPADRPRPPVLSARGALLRRTLPAHLAADLARLGRTAGETHFMVLLAGLSALLARWTAREDVAVGSAVANRTRAEVEGLIGFFVNTLVLRTDLSGDPTFLDLLGRVRRTALAAFAHQDLPFEKVVEAAAPERDASRTPLFQVMLTLQNAPMGALTLPGLRLALLPPEGGGARFDLSLSFAPGPDGWTGTWEYRRDLFDAPTVARLAGHLETLLAAAAGPGGTRRSLWDLPLLSSAERDQLLVEWSGGEAPYPREASLHALFAGQAALRSDAVALVVDGAPAEHLSYGGLASRAELLARRLVALGVALGTRVGLCLDRSAERVVATLAVLAAGGAYVPLDPAYPKERLDFLVRDSAAPLLLTVEPLLPALPETGAAVLLLDRPAAPVSGPPPSEMPAESLAYVMYTSGSTGTPKGVAVPQRGVVRLVRGAEYAHFGPDEIFLQLAPYAFDASTLELWGALLHGGRAVMPSPGPLSLAEIQALVKRHGVTTLHLTAGLFHQAVDAGLSGFAGLSQLLTGGDALSAVHVSRAAAELPETRLLCCYGPTENTTFTAVHPVAGPLPAGTAPLGRPIANTRVHVLDRASGPAPLGVPGELFAGGDGLAWGYLGRPDLTAERFLPDPFSPSPGERLYRTGDLARWRPSGWLEFLGRIDAQVKIRGFRVEPGEVEAALLTHPGVREAVVVVRGEAGEDRRLVAYVVAGKGEEQAAADLAAWLRGRLPEYMVPAAFVHLPELPLTPMGKVDRRALPAPDWRPVPGGISPRTPLEEVIAALVAEIVGIGQVGVTDSFFHLGGHSLHAVQLVSRLQTVFRVELPLRRLFETPTVEALAAAVLAGEARPGQSEKLARVLLRNSSPYPKSASPAGEAVLQRELV